MGAPTEPSKSSLDRLKALDDLPDLDSQLHEAKQLCDHHARAEMILKWLMAKLKASDQVRKENSSWDLFTSTVRLLPAQRIAVLTNGIVPVLQLAWAAPDLPGETIRAIARLFKTLTELGWGPDGAAIRALLSVNGDLAARMCGDWYRHVYHNFPRDGKISSLVKEALLDPALQLWELRQHTEFDDISFSDYCVVSILLLLAQLRSTETPTSSKRKRGHDVAIPVTTRKYEHSLEALIAKHTILPARSIFNRKHEQQPRRMLHGQQRTKQPEINERLSKLGEAIASHASGGSPQPIVGSLCLVLDVALRSVSTPTPRHRLAERPWIETLFTALCDCVAGQDRLVINRTLIDLLETIRRNGVGQTALSPKTLTGLVKNHAIAGTESKEEVNWQLVAKIVELEPDVLTDSTLAEELFSAITDAQDHESSPRVTLWKTGIIIPTMNAYARVRSLSVFQDLWHKQLFRPRSSSEPSVWESLSAPFADILEEYLLGDQIVAQIDRFASPLDAMLESKAKLGNEETTLALSANIVLLESLMRGVRSDGLISSSQDKLHALFRTLVDLANLKGFKSTLAPSRHYWRLSERVFQLWFPLWATKQDGVAAVESEGMAILTGKAFKYALAQCPASATDQSFEPLAHTAHAAQAFVARLCACFQQYGAEQGCAGRCAGAMEHLVKHKASGASIFVRQPILFSSLDSSAREAALSSPSLFAYNTRSGESAASAPIEALLDSSRGTDSQLATRDVLSLMLKQLNREQDIKTTTDETTLVSALANIDALSFEQTQRIAILDTVSQLGKVPASRAGAVLLRDRLALLLKLLVLPCQNAQLLADPARVWELTNLFDSEAKAVSSKITTSSELDSLDNVELFEAIVRSVLSSWLTTQEREKSQEALVQVSQIIKDAVKLGTKKSGLSTNVAQLAFIKVTISILEDRAGDDLKPRLVHRAPKTARSYVDTLSAECSSSSRKKVESSTTEKSAVSALQALLNVPKSLVALSGIDTSDHATRVYKIARELMSPSQAHGNDITHSRLVAVCFHIISRYAPDRENLTALAEGVLARDLRAKELSEVLGAYEEAFKQGDTDWKLAAIVILTKDPGSWNFSSILLRQAILKAMVKEDAEAMPSTKDIVFQTLDALKSPSSLLTIKRTALQSLTLIFKDKGFLVTQYTIEQTLATLQEILSSDIPADINKMYLSICQVLTVVLANHRSRLQGRFHLLVGLLQQLTSHLFHDGKAGVHEGRSLAKLLESFCNPPALRYRKGGKPSDLVDEAKHAQAHAGQFAQYVLHNYCSCVLAGSLGEGVREALLPGLWAVIESMEAYNEDGIRVLSAAANNSERAVLRSVYEDWKKFGKWEGV